MTNGSALRRAAFAVGAIIASLLVMATVSAAARVAPLTATDLDRLAISTYSDVTQLDPAAVPAHPVTRDQVVALANAYLGLTDIPVTVLLARAPLIRGQADRDMWIVIYPGTTTAPMDGPDGASPSIYTITAVLFDASTGEFVRGYMR